MAEGTPTAKRWIGWLQFSGLLVLLAILQLMPFQTDPDRWPAPDWILAVTLAWVIRRPDLLPAPLVALSGLATDLLFQRPPGLGAAVLLLTTEVLRSRTSDIRSAPFPVEWAAAALAIVAGLMLSRWTLALVMLERGPFGLEILSAAITVIAYPLVVLFSYVVFGISRPAPGEVDSRGQKL